MAKSIYLQQQRMADAALQSRGQAQPHSYAQSHAHGTDTDTVVSESIDGSSSGRPVDLQEAAYRMAQERLKKLQEELERNKELQGYYGNSAAPPSGRFNLSLTDKLRRRSVSMSQMFHNDTLPRRKTISPADQQPAADDSKRQQDRNALMDAARRNVSAQLKGMDEKVFMQTGRMAPSLLSEWELRAHTAAQAKYELSQDERRGKLDVGGGMFISRSDVDAIARKRVQPLLDNINDKAKTERERLELLRVEQEAKKQEHNKLKAQDRELREINKRAREHIKQEARIRQEQRDGRENSDDEPAPRRLDKLIRRPTTLDTTDRLARDGPKSADEAASPTSKVKTWLRSRLTMRREAGDEDEISEPETKGFLGGKALKDSLALANRDAPGAESSSPAITRRPTVGTPGISDSRPVSPISDTHEGVPGNKDIPMTPPRPIQDPMAVGVSGSPNSPGRDSRFREIFTDAV